MFESLFDRIADEGTSELFFLLTGSVILLCIQQVYLGIRRALFRRKVRSEISAYRQRKDAINVVDLATGDPEFAKRNIFSRDVSHFGEKFVSNADGMIFNAKKYGVYNLRFTRFGEEESPGVEVDLFETDYFTHKVFRSIYHELKSEGHEIARANADTFLKYRPFMTSSWRRTTSRSAFPLFSSLSSILRKILLR